MLGKHFSRQHFEIFPFFPPEERIRHFMQTLFLIESYFLGKKYKKNHINLPTAESAHSMVSVKTA